MPSCWRALLQQQCSGPGPNGRLTPGRTSLASPEPELRRIDLLAHISNSKSAAAAAATSPHSVDHTAWRLRSLAVYASR
ncbi:hypothetical protein GQ55_8G045000 [Panicum hallii var. hallii]|uniref:Uncharacterized protein n=1 Tax=Panicum hallii var. hallii TaxID=1504633 RepID=A0A2T7CKP9_9POAL|nr:hypothetical protein GQ55_8G045000 [Panicum hallii var. hallii]